MSMSIIIGNILSLCAMISDSISGTRKKHSEIMAVQIISQFFYGSSSFVLKGYSGTVQNIVAVFRNYAAMKNIKSKFIEWILISLAVIFGIIFNSNGIIGYLPVVANFEYSVSVFKFKNNEKALKIAFIVNMVMFAIFNFVIKNYIGTFSCAIISLTTFFHTKS
ncbi:MAG: YgjV family protein [Lachnospiraceae bacterium]|nr:YgjV family protein [Lachnospiraceae bacterium]